MTVLSEAVLEFVPAAALRRAVEQQGTLVVVVGFADGLELCRGLRMLAQRHPATRFALAGTEGALAARHLGSLTNVTLLGALPPAPLAWLVANAHLVLCAGGEPPQADVPVVALPADPHTLVALASEPVQEAESAMAL
ncbi:MAG: hypothetical protein M3P39_05880 [Actinomycetota bacterium]|nr:hypothetical protein [Actinomycetota bacterium]